MNTPTARLSQSTAILLERARRFDVSDETLLAGVASGDTAALKVAEAQYYSYDEFYTYAAAHGEDLDEAIRHGYKIKFNTPGGVQLWLGERYGLEAGKDYDAIPGRLDGVKLPAEAVELARRTLAVNWAVLDVTESGAGETASEAIQAQASSEPGEAVNQASSAIAAGSAGLRTVTFIVRSLLDDAKPQSNA